MFGTAESEELATQIKMAREHKKAMFQNPDTLKKMYRQNRGIIIMSLVLFDCLARTAAPFMTREPRRR